MWRKIEADLARWKDSPHRKPLIVKGVRQCGKTHTLREFGKSSYDSCAYFNFESDPGLRRVFERDLDPHRIVSELSGLSKIDISEGGTLIILDEIQCCGEALASLKYFCENAPGYHVACAGSLLGVALSKLSSFPVGKVDFMTLRPMDFREYMAAMGYGKMAGDISGGSVPAGYEGALDRLMREYLFVGGMPEAVSAWAGGEGPERVADIQAGILDSYEGDILRHAPRSEIGRIRDVWRSIPEQLAKDNRKFMFGQAREGGRARELADALEWIMDAGLAHKVKAVSRPEAPLRMFEDGSCFKVYACDVGLLGRMCNIGYGEHVSGLGPMYRGALAENYVLTQILPLFGDVCYWRDGAYEVDFLVGRNGSVVPIEVKPGARRRSRSLAEYIDRYDPDAALVFSSEGSEGGGAISAPLYLAWAAGRLIDCRLDDEAASHGGADGS